MTSKLLIGVAVLAGVLVIAAVTGRKSVHSESVVAAPPEAVWRVLVDSAAHRDWNPVLVPVAGELAAGRTVTYAFTQEPGQTYTMEASVREIAEPRLINQTGGTFGVLTFDHRYVLEPVDGGTRVTIHEDYRGIGVHFWDPGPVQDAYDRLNAALRDRVLSLSKRDE